ncbi:Alpha/Beta hydrolase protein [Lanmaoa asiatica]|nr:Alpha/Beta hydrolase protein [Lanmaoa asiatica]
MPRESCAVLLLFASAFSSFPFAQAQSLPGSWPQVYPGMPAGDYSPEWQNYFRVTEPLPNVSWPLARNWAGNIPVQRADHPNDTLFFWAFESSNGSFTANCSEPWGIWLNGGPGASSLVGLLFEVRITLSWYNQSIVIVILTCVPQSGPIQLFSNYSAFENQYAWTTVADYVWIDQPVGTGFSTADANGYVPDEDQLGADFMGFLENLVKVFPNLATRPLHLTGESYAGTYIPYITKAYFEMDNPPVHLAGIAIGDGVITSFETFEELPVISVLETYPQIIGYDTQVFEYFREQSALCGYNLTLQYPQPEHFPTLNAALPLSGSAYSRTYNAKLIQKRFVDEVQGRLASRLKERDGSVLEHDETLRARDVWKRDLAGRANGTIDPWYQCDLYTEMIDYAVNFTFPWCTFPFFSLRLIFHSTIRLLALGAEFDYYNIPDALSPEPLTDASVFLNDAQTRAAIHAPTSKDWVEVIPSPFASANSSSKCSKVRPMAFLTDLATNATAHGMAIVIYSGNDDSLVPHFGSQGRNTTFGGIQGFTRRPETPWYNDAGELAGIVHQERGWTYILVAHAGHLLGYTNPSSALTLVREFIFGNNQTGLVTNTSSGTVTVIGGEVSSLGGEIMTGEAAIYYGQATTESSYLFPSATVEAWDAYIATATATSRASSIISTGSVTSNIFCLGSALVATVLIRLL